MSKSTLSFLNGAIAGAGAVLVIMSSALLMLYAPLELSKALTTTELRVAIFLGAIVFAITIAYEFYKRKPTDPQNKIVKKNDELVTESESIENQEESKVDE